MAADRLIGAVLVHDSGLHDRTWRAGRGRLGQEEVAGVDRDDAVDLGEAIAGAGPAIDAVLNLLHEIRLDRCAPAAEVGEARGVPFLKIWTVDQLARHGRHTGECRRTFPLDDLQRFLGVPAVHEEELSPHRSDWVQATVAASDVE